MKRIRALQLLVYVVFASLFLRGLIAGGIYGFKEGYNDAKNVNHDSFREIEPLDVVLNGSYLTHTANGSLKIGDKYQLENVNITATLRVNNNKVDAPFMITGLKWITILVLVVIVCRVAYNINVVIKRIVNGIMFETDCIKLLRNTGLLMLLYTFINLLYEELCYYEQSLLVQLPLKVINTSSFDFTTLILAILVFIVAEAFKQGARLKEEQALVI